MDTAKVSPLTMVDTEFDDTSAKSQLKVEPGTESHREQRRRFKIAARHVVICLRRISRVNVLKKFLDLYVKSLGFCAQNYSHQSYGMGFSATPSSPFPGSLIAMNSSEVHYRSSDSCLSPAFKQSFNESLLPGCRDKAVLLKGANIFPESQPMIRRSFSDYESCLSPSMKKLYTEAAAISPGRHSWCNSPGRTSRHMFGGQTMIIFPIDEDPELTRASLRKESGFMSVARTGTVQVVSKTELETFVEVV